MPDEPLIGRILGGEQAAFDELVRNHQREVYGYLRARMLQHSDAEDLTQEVFLRFLRTRDRYDGAQPLRPWLLGIARNLLREHARRRRRGDRQAWTEVCLELESLMPDEPSPVDEEAISHLPDCLAGLGPSARQAIELHYTGNLRLAEIGTQLKRSEGAVKLLVFRARQALKRCLLFRNQGGC
ncbi:MAG: sigma-70 family RNA polymerase sigma factor [Planctomycetaceae bacterium]|nr:sigma-70 family RNA polymerase sigma factor [Planctomycetaceae bacterium]